MITLIISSIAMFGMVYYGSVRLWNCCLALAGNATREPPIIDWALALSATVFFVAQSLS